MSQPSKLYIHCGMHKTGTTALQDALRASELPLRRAGLLVPRTGRQDGPAGKYVAASYSGHHNIAWELTRDRRFNPQRGTVAALGLEIGAFAGDVILSSEDFETLLPTPERFAPLRQIADVTGRRMVLLVYVRSQLTYWESLFPELLKYGSGQEYDVLARWTLETGHLEIDEWDFQFDYERVMVDTLGKRSEFDLIVRNYHALGKTSIVGEVARILGVPGVLKAMEGSEYTNVREPPAVSLERFYRNRTGGGLSLPERSRIKRLCRDLPPLATAPALALKFAERFQDGNRRLCESMGIPEAGLAMDQAPTAPASIDLGQFFSFETQCIVRSGGIEDGALRSWNGGIVDWWNQSRAVRGEAKILREHAHGYLRARRSTRGRFLF